MDITDLYDRAKEHGCNVVFRGETFDDQIRYSLAACEIVTPNRRLYETRYDCPAKDWGAGFQTLVENALAEWWK